MSKTATKKSASPEVGDEAVLKRTGKRWPEWFKILDKAGARDMPHKEIALWLSEHHGDMGGWWCQMVTVAYERARDKRVKHETPQGFQISASRTIEVPVRHLYAAWTDAKLRAKWMPKAAYTVTKATRDKSLRILWEDEKSRVSVHFYPKGKLKAQVSVQHAQLSSAAAARRMKTYWNARLDRMCSALQAAR